MGARITLSNFLPALLVLGVLYSFTVLITLTSPGVLPTGWQKSYDEWQNTLSYGIESESVKILSFNIHYPDTNDTQTSYIVSWYMTHGCIRPANNSNAVPGMCNSHKGYMPLNLSGLILEAEKFNSILPGFNNSVTRPSATTAAVRAAAGVMNSRGPFILIIFTVILSAFGWLAIWLIPRKISLVLLFVAMGLGIGSAAWLKVLADQAKSRLDTINPQYATGARPGHVFMGLLWSAVAALIVSFLSAVGHVFMNPQNEEYGQVWSSCESSDDCI